MKNLLPVLFLIFIPILPITTPIITAQEIGKNQIENLNKTKQRLEFIIKIKQDSLILINQQIDRIPQEELLLKLKA